MAGLSRACRGDLNVGYRKRCGVPQSARTDCFLFGLRSSRADLKRGPAVKMGACGHREVPFGSMPWFLA